MKKNLVSKEYSSDKKKVLANNIPDLVIGVKLEASAACSEDEC